MAIPNQKLKKYLFPAIAGTVGVGVVITVCLLIVYNLPKKAQNRATKQKEVMKSELDKCGGLMEQFLIYKDGGMDQEKLNEYYDKCAAECPDDFIPRVRKEEAANSEKVRARLAQKKVEMKVETGVNNEKNDLHQSKDSKIVGTVKPAVVVQSNDSKPELKINPAEKNDSKSAVKKSGEKNEEEKLRVPLKADDKKADFEKPDITKPDTNLPKDDSKPNTKVSKSISKTDTKDISETVTKEPKDASESDTKVSKDTSKTGTKMTKDFKALPPKELKEKRAETKKELVDMIKDIIALKKPNFEFSEDQKNHIAELSIQGVLPPYYRWPQLVKDFWQGELLKLYKSGDVAKAQEMFKTFLKKFSLLDDDDDDDGKVPKGSIITEFDDYKFWKAVTEDNQAEAVKLLDQPIFLPAFIRDALKTKPEKIKLLKSLNGAQMDALWDYCLLNKQREKYLGYYNGTGDEHRMAKHAANYNRTAEQMRLLNEDIHKEFDFAVPILPQKQSLMEKLEEYFKDNPNKSEEFDARFAKLKENKGIEVSLVMKIVDDLAETDDKIKLLETIKELKSNDIKEHLIDILIAALKDQLLEDHVWNYMDKAKFKKSQDLPAIIELLKDISSHGNPSAAQAGFYKNYITFLQGLTETDEEELHQMAHVTPFDIRQVANCLSFRNLGAEGKPLVKYSYYCIKCRAEKVGASELEKAEYSFAQAYLKIYEAVDGKDMTSLFQSPPINHYLAVDAQVVADLIRSEKEICKLNTWSSQFDGIKSDIVALVNSKVVVEMNGRRKKLEDLPDNLDVFSNVDRILDEHSVDVDNLPRVLEACAVNKLLQYFDANIYCEWQIAQGTKPVSAKEVKDSFILAKTEASKESKKSFLEAAANYVQTLQQQIVEEIKTSLKT